MIKVTTQARDTCRLELDRQADILVALSRSIHAEPELAFAEHRSAAKVVDVVERAGFRIERGVGGLHTAFTATYGAGDLVVGLCAEYDALPEIGHACGHNIIAAASTGAALALAAVADRIGITVKLIGTPAEETGGGKVLLLEQGIFDDVAMAMMVHPGQHERCAAPSLAVTDLQVHYSGVAAHAASAPERGVNAADALTVTQVAVGLLRQHLEPRQQVHGIVTVGGAAPNIVPADTRALYYLRAPDVASLRRLESRIRDCFAAGAIATGCGHDVVQVSPVYAELVSDGWLADTYRRVLIDLGRTPTDDSRPIGSTDMGNVSHMLPAIHPTIAIDCGDAVPHQPEFTVASATPSADHAVLDGALAMAWTAVAAATDDAQRERLLDGVSARATQTAQAARMAQTSGPVVTDSAPIAESAPRHRGESAAAGGAV
jgi:amidohydrolase